MARDARFAGHVKKWGQPCEVRVVSLRALKGASASQILTDEEGDLALSVTGAIVFHMAERHAGMLPNDANAWARAIKWTFAALNTVEPPMLELATAKLL